MKLFTLLFFLSIMIAILVVAPLLSIWSLNTLFGLGIEYMLSTWFAMVWLSAVTFGSIGFALSKKDSLGRK
jgi:hypothetical protein